ncbi:thiamine biosynthesis lipoprotein [Mycoplana sp. BE70]|uniref:FAD:protein FMN transferase n=1 Tax=Mycoplana sp. BE70 TaxID=2817775 RepID=UPI00285DB3F0|nr:FAD:protein FMN transferase [Mycoplana sp. BE70]MDR6755828.1 thiamine biosynthesis lipoprotein [Mycoplana sp. BE70]
MAELISRRRAITIIAAVGGLPLLSVSDLAKAAVEPVIWKGQALGAPATLIINHPDRSAAERLISRVVSEVDRLESIFSLYREASALNELNRVGGLAVPPPELVEVLGACRTAWEATDGVFDPTIQPLWALYARHFSSPAADAAGPSRQDLKEAQTRTGFDAVRFSRDRIAFARPNMALTLNGIAQGYVTDRVVALLRAGGITSSLVSMGENRAIGATADGSAWRIGLADTEAGAQPDTVLGVIDKAVATSSAAGFHFDRAGRFGHILDPRSGAMPPRYRRVTVIAPDATTADAFSTAASLVGQAEIETIVSRNSSLTVDLVLDDGKQARFGKAVDVL